MKKLRLVLIVVLILCLILIVDRMFLNFYPNIYCGWRPNWICPMTPECGVSGLHVNESLFEAGKCVKKFAEPGMIK